MKPTFTERGFPGGILHEGAKSAKAHEEGKREESAYTRSRSPLLREPSPLRAFVKK
jgi:hypothetical protein